MRLPLFVAVTVVVLSLLACNGPEQPGTDTSTDKPLVKTPDSAAAGENTLVETPEYSGVIFAEDASSAFNFLFGATTVYWEPSVEDVTNAEACIRQFLVSAPEDPTLYPDQKANAPFILENLENYRRQYVGIVADGEKRIWVNAFFDEGLYPDWAVDPIYVLDGGRYYWDIEYIPSKDDCVNFAVHGEA